MFAVYWAVVLALFVFVHARDPLDGVKGIVQRRLPGHADSFTFELIAGNDESFIVSDLKDSSSSNSKKGYDKIAIQCTTVSACSRGLYT
jgi:alpha-N-acetylglucosaminidase